MKVVLAPCKDIFPPRAANTGGSQRPVRSPECAPSFPNLNLGASITLRVDVTLLRCGRILKNVRGLRLTKPRLALQLYVLTEFPASKRYHSVIQRPVQSTLWLIRQIYEISGLYLQTFVGIKMWLSSM